MGPLDILGNYGTTLGYITAFAIGLGFGAVLELSGFGDSRVLAAQFYLKEMRVLKVMFTAIIVAMTLIFFSYSVELLDFSKLYVNPTYLFPGVVGGLIMGVGFIVGGFCPGTSLVSASTGKLDGMFFIGGVLFGVFSFGESFPVIEEFHNSYFMGRFTLPELFGLDAGIVVLLVLIMAFVMFYGAEISEAFFGKGKKLSEIEFIPHDKKKIAAAGFLIFIALVTILLGEPTTEDRWSWIAGTENQKLEERQVYIHPGELYEIMNDPLLYSTLVDVRSERDYNIFHLEDASRADFSMLKKVDVIKKFKTAPANTVVIVMSNNEKEATEAYKILRAQGVINIYILSGGINNWINTYGIDDSIAVRRSESAIDEGDRLEYRFVQAVGGTVYPANPRTADEHDLPKLEFEKKVKVQKKKTISGGCG